MKGSLALLIALLALPAVSAEPDAAARTEIAHLLQ
jgi:hypothetical protein